MNRKELISEITKAVHDEMFDSIADGMPKMYIELEFGLALVHVDVHIVRLRNGQYLDDVDVAVTHDDADHHSPLLEKAIREALPNWFDVMREVRLTA